MILSIYSKKWTCNQVIYIITYKSCVKLLKITGPKWPIMYNTSNVKKLKSQTLDKVSFFPNQLSTSCQLERSCIILLFYYFLSPYCRLFWVKTSSRAHLDVTRNVNIREGLKLSLLCATHLTSCTEIICKTQLHQLFKGGKVTMRCPPL